MKQTTKQIIVKELGALEDKAVIVTSHKGGFTDIGLIRNERTLFIIELSEDETTNQIDLQQIYPIHGFVSKFSINRIEDAITRINKRIKDAE